MQETTCSNRLSTGRVPRRTARSDRRTVSPSASPRAVLPGQLRAHRGHRGARDGRRSINVLGAWRRERAMTADSKQFPPLACVPGAIAADHRATHLALIERLFGSRVRGKVRLPNGYEFTFDSAA